MGKLRKEKWLISKTFLSGFLGVMVSPDVKSLQLRTDKSPVYAGLFVFKKEV